VNPEQLVQAVSLRQKTTKKTHVTLTLTLMFNRFVEVVKVHVHAEFHQGKCSGSWVIVLTERKLNRKKILPSLPRAVVSNYQ